jgi:hypothetical protein
MQYIPTKTNFPLQLIHPGNPSVTIFPLKVQQGYNNPFKEEFEYSRSPNVEYYIRAYKDMLHWSNELNWLKSDLLSLHNDMTRHLKQARYNEIQKELHKREDLIRSLATPQLLSDLFATGYYWLMSIYRRLDSSSLDPGSIIGDATLYLLHSNHLTSEQKLSAIHDAFIKDKLSKSAYLHWSRIFSHDLSKKRTTNDPIQPWFNKFQKK